MHDKVEVSTEASKEELNLESPQEWYSFNEFKPLWGSEAKGDHGGRYLCIVERPSNPECLGHVPGGVSKSVEMCYFNDLAQRFQDSANEWVDVAYWTQVPKTPFHKSELINRDDMMNGIKHDVLKLVSYHKETDEHYDLSIQCDLASVSYNTKLYYSSTRSNHIEDYMYCIRRVN